MALQLEDFLITGRTFDEYTAFFGLDADALKGKKVLDCPSGVSGFVAEAVRRGIDAHGCDILYDFDAESIIAQAQKSIVRIYEDTGWMEGYNFSFYGSIDAHRRCREGALNTFKADFGTPRYRFEMLPELSYENDSFDLLLSSHLLFVYDDRLERDFHIATIAEMLRVAREVRIFPLVDFQNSRRDDVRNYSPFVEEVLKRFNAQIVHVDFEFQPGAGAMLRVLR